MAIISFPLTSKADGLRDFQSKFPVLWAAKMRVLRKEPQFEGNESRHFLGKLLWNQKQE